MIENPVYRLLRADLEYLQSVLVDLQLWQDTPPSLDALASQEPFAVDTMAFNQWLQWLFMPKLMQLMDLEEPLPMNSNIAAMAEYWCQLEGIKDRHLIDALKTIDRRLSSQSQQHQQ